MKIEKFTFLIVLGLLLSGPGMVANNITVSNTKLTGQNTSDGYTIVQFDLIWENSSVLHWHHITLMGHEYSLIPSKSRQKFTKSITIQSQIQ